MQYASFLTYQEFKRTTLCYFAVFQNYDIITVLNGVQPMSYSYHDSIFKFFSFAIFQMVFSVPGSTCAVGSSKITILLRRNNARAKQISCLSPSLKFVLLTHHSWSSLPLRFSTRGFICKFSKTFQNLASSYAPEGSRFFLYTIPRKEKEFD